jgi:hypothetical protein
MCKVLFIRKLTIMKSNRLRKNQNKIRKDGESFPMMPIFYYSLYKTFITAG